MPSSCAEYCRLLGSCRSTFFPTEALPFCGPRNARLDCACDRSGSDSCVPTAISVTFVVYGTEMEFFLDQTLLKMQDNFVFPNLVVQRHQGKPGVDVAKALKVVSDSLASIVAEAEELELPFRPPLVYVLASGDSMDVLLKNTALLKRAAGILVLDPVVEANTRLSTNSNGWFVSFSQPNGLLSGGGDPTEVPCCGKSPFDLGFDICTPGSVIPCDFDAKTCGNATFNEIEHVFVHRFARDFDCALLACDSLTSPGLLTHTNLFEDSCVHRKVSSLILGDIQDAFANDLSTLPPFRMEHNVALGDRIAPALFTSSSFSVDTKIFDESKAFDCSLLREPQFNFECTADCFEGFEVPAIYLFVGVCGSGAALALLFVAAVDDKVSWIQNLVAFFADVMSALFGKTFEIVSWTVDMCLKADERIKDDDDESLTETSRRVLKVWVRGLLVWFATISEIAGLVFAVVGYFLFKNTLEDKSPLINQRDEALHASSEGDTKDYIRPSGWAGLSFMLTVGGLIGLLSAFLLASRESHEAIFLEHGFFGWKMSDVGRKRHYRRYRRALTAIMFVCVGGLGAAVFLDFGYYLSIDKAWKLSFFILVPLAVILVFYWRIRSEHNIVNSLRKSLRLSVSSDATKWAEKGVWRMIGKVVCFRFIKPNVGELPTMEIEYDVKSGNKVSETFYWDSNRRLFSFAYFACCNRTSLSMRFWRMLMFLLGLPGLVVSKVLKCLVCYERRKRRREGA